VRERFVRLGERGYTGSTKDFAAGGESGGVLSRQLAYNARQQFSFLLMVEVKA